MKSQQLTTSAVLFWNSASDEVIPIDWFERAIELFRAHRLSPILFTAGGSEFELDDCYVLAEPGDDLVKWGETIVARRRDLVDALRQGEISSLSLDSPRADSVSRSDWHAKVSVDVSSGELYVGLDQELVRDPTGLLAEVYKIVKGLFDIRYGITYKMPLDEEPACYASGFVKTPLSEVLDWIRHRREWDSRKESPEELWADELYQKRRHLAGLFRGAYPASILSESHVHTADLISQPIGKLTKLDGSLWLWELSETERPHAEAMLRERKLLVSQVDGK